MKFTKKQEVKFQPIAVTITIETEVEQQVLRELISNIDHHDLKKLVNNRCDPTHLYDLLCGIYQMIR